MQVRTISDEIFINFLIRIEGALAGFRRAEGNSSTGIAFASSSSPSPSAKARGCGKWDALALTLCVLLAPAAVADLSLSHHQAMQIGRKIWENECGGSLAGLSSWNGGENFASLGIGHFIWYPAGQRGPFEESFPKFVLFASNHQAPLPAWLQPNSSAGPKPCPWNSRSEFYQASQTAQMKELRQFLAKTIDLQAAFMADRLQE